MIDLKEKFLFIRKAAIRGFFSKMNDRQFEAVTAVNGPLMVLAGAGSGKTTVLVNRILNLIKFGNAYNSDEIPFPIDENTVERIEKAATSENLGDEPYLFSVDAVKPWQILAITFTNKAASELQNRISATLDGSSSVRAGTFHSLCAEILRYNGDRLGYSSDFAIYDTDDQKRLIKLIMKELRIEEKMFPVRSVVSVISSQKNSLKTPSEFYEENQSDVRLSTIAEIYKRYEKSLKEANAMDFDDLIGNTVKLFETQPDILEKYQDRYRYIMVDEYQDTNHAQYAFVSLLAKKYSNLCVVGDDDQSIYKFRGATIENILNFEDEYKGCKVIRLEQNYRSTQNILSAANAVIANNSARKGKNLWTDKGNGEKILVNTARDEQDEARFVADEILKNVENGGKFSENAVLYRTNAQSNTIENFFVRSAIPYKIVGGLRFYERKEIKDVLAYLSVINNREDTIRLRRIINEPKRGIGEATVSHAADIASDLGIPLFQVFEEAADYPAVSRAASKLKEFTSMINDLAETAQRVTVSELLELTLEATGYIESLKRLGFEGEGKIENINELITNILQYEKETEEPSLSDFLNQIALISDIDNYNENDDSVVLMTIHSAKGLEFDNVFLIGMEEGIFPGNQSIYGGEAEIEEERRLAYVSITRARKRLCITNAFSRMLYGQTNRNVPSRFLEEIPKELCDVLNTRDTYSMGGYHNIQGFGFGNSRNLSGAGAAARNYGGERKSPTLRDSFAPQTEKKSSSNSSYRPGDRVRHKTFGDGLVISSVPMGNDTLLEIAFDDCGTKKVMSNFAKLIKI